MASVNQFLAGAVAIAGLLLPWFLFMAKSSKQSNKVWTQLDVVGISPGDGALSWAFALAKSVISMQGTMCEGYEKFSKANKPFALPTMWVGGAVLVLPPSKLGLLNKPRNELSSFNALLENAQFQYLMSDKDVWGNTIHFDIVRRHLREKDMSSLTKILFEEWQGAFQTYWGDSKEGRVIQAWDSMVRIIARASLRIMVGLPGCRDEDYLEQSMLYANAVLVDACLINCLPPGMRPMAGPLIALRAKYYERKLLKILIPLVEERLFQYRHVKESQRDGQGDVIRWLIEISENYGPEQLAAKKIAGRILALTSMFVFAIGWVFVHVVLDIHCSSSRDEIVSTLIAECQKVSAQYQGLSSKEAIDKLYCLDSAVRESMRLNDVMVHLLPLDIISGQPINIGEAIQISADCGLRTVFPAQMVHHDRDIYQNPEHFDPFRFSREHETLSNKEPTKTKREFITTWKLQKPWKESLTA
ncbi:hypothetical protein TRV_01127 [Trichophyton verrucosum HKI 0517]|uniref:Cytochrome P450 n=1 Tax=Trichophyton verrucosum (strain HKI 0517) TaxID=663202 RepID=D4D225_TRIVH|nr:uncharacterized protein TRV_01127 [Trichophyton verrucosum HKI 0517]EFE44109.1 hypothetical protein TRV_01127 [Trichophyton verrucosum HKI 0517]